MNYSSIEFVGVLARNALLLSLGALFVLLLIRSLKIRSAAVQRAAWLIVLAQGLWLWPARPTVEVAVPSAVAQSHWWDYWQRLSTFRDANAPTWDVGASATEYVATANTNPSTPLAEGQTLRFDPPGGKSASQSIPNLTETDGTDPGTQNDRATGSAMAVPATRAESGLASVDRKVASTTLAAGQPASYGWPHWPWANWLVSGWVLGCLWVVFRNLLCWCLFQFSMRESRPARASWQRQWQALHRTSKSAWRRVPLLEHDHHGPMLTVTPSGLAIVVPVDYWEELSPGQRLAVLRHELAHLERGDIAWSLMVRAIAVPQWFNPFAWLAVHRFDECAEWSCDQRLKEAGPSQAKAFANAIVKLLEFPGLTPIAARSAGGAASMVRLRRLLGIDQVEDSKMKRGLLIAGLIGLVGLGLFRVQLVANGGAPDPIDAASESVANAGSTDERVAGFVEKLDVEHDASGLLGKLKTALATEAGQIAIGERIANHEYALRQKAEAEATPLYVRQYFEKQGDSYRLKPGQEEFARQLISACEGFDRDIAEISKILSEYQSRLGNTTEAEQLLSRILRESSGAMQIYVQHVMQRSRPDPTVIQEQFAEQLVLNRNNRWTIRGDQRETIEELVRNLENAQRIAVRLRRELDGWRTDLDSSDSLAMEVKTIMGESAYACLAGLNSLNDDYGMDQIMDDYFGYIEGMFVDRAHGLVAAEDRVEEIKGVVKNYIATRQLAEKVRTQLSAFANRIEAGDGLSDRLRQVLPTEMGAVWLARELDPIDASPSVIVRNLLDSWLESDDQGKLQVREDRREELINMARESLREGRAMRRRGAEFEELADHLTDEKLAACYRSPSGKWLAMRTIQNAVARQYFDGMQSWVDEHFDKTDDGYLLKPDHDGEINDLLMQVDNLSQELAKDDF